MSVSWEDIRTLPVIAALYTADASDSHRLPYDIRDALGDLLMTTDFEAIKSTEQKAFNDSALVLINRQSLTQELWSRWLKVPLPAGSKLKKHNHRTLFEMLQTTAAKEHHALQDLVKESEASVVAKGEETEEKPETIVKDVQPTEEEPSHQEEEDDVSMKSTDDRIEEVLAIAAGSLKPRRRPSHPVLDLIAEFTQNDSQLRGGLISW